VEIASQQVSYMQVVQVLEQAWQLPVQLLLLVEHGFLQEWSLLLRQE
jgi:hypothetical protein